MAVAGQHVGKSAAQGAGNQPVPHRPAIDVGILLQRIGTAETGHRHQAVQADAAAPAVDRQRIVAEGGAHDLADAR